MGNTLNAVTAVGAIDTAEVANVASMTTVAVQPAANTATAVPPSMKYSEDIRARLSGLASEAANWEATVYTTANEGLYALMQKCYQLYKDLTNASDTNLKYKKQGLSDYLAMNGMSAYNDKPLPQRIIRCVFGDRDRRRISTYNVALRVIIAECWAVADVPAEIAARGGVQEMTMARKPGAMTAKQKAESAAALVRETALATVKTAATDAFVDEAKIGEKYAAVLTQEADGTFTLNCIVDNGAAVNAALAAYYKAEKAKAAASK